MTQVHTDSDILWQPEDALSYGQADTGRSLSTGYLAVIDATIDDLSSDLRVLSLDIHGMVLYFIDERRPRAAVITY
jgi:hypothetical protein